MRNSFLNLTIRASAGAKHVAPILAAAALSWSTAAMSQTAATPTPPHLSGVYAMEFTSICQGSLGTSQNGNGQVSVTYQSQDTSQHLATATFAPSKTDPTSGNLSLNGNKVAGSPLIVTGTGGQSGGNPFAAGTESQTIPYKLTSTTFSITIPTNSGTANVNYNAVHGAVPSGIIQSFMFGGIDNDGCMTNGVGIHQ
jgi:hypothetical protein